MTKNGVFRAGLLLTAIAAGAFGATQAKADPTVYITGTGNEFGTMNMSTGAFTSIGTLGLPAGDSIFGMGFGADGNLYGVDSAPNANMFQINTSTGALTNLGAIGQNAIDATADASGKLHVISQDSNAAYYTMNPPGTTPTVIGLTGITSAGLAAVNAAGTALYTTVVNPASNVTSLASINLVTGAATTIGDTGFGIDAGLFVDGTLDGFDFLSDAIVSIDTSTGAGTQIATFSLPAGDLVLAAAEAPASSATPVPEPASLALFLAALLGLGAVRLRGRAAFTE